MIDLHCHSRFSDGLHSPEELVGFAVKNGIEILALTDHDTIEGLKPLYQAALHASLHIISGIEISTSWKKQAIHVIGLDFDVEGKTLIEAVDSLKQSRIQRALLIAERIQVLGIEKSYDKACKIAGHEYVGRPHFAQVLVDEGYVRDISEAFKRFLRRGRPAYVHAPWMDITVAVKAILKSGGCPVLAHPLKYQLTRTKLEELVKTFKMAGGVGLEVVSGQVNEAQMHQLSELCSRFELLASTGSDFHGEGISRIALGRQPRLPLNCKPIWNEWSI